jgi:signal peptidase I
VGEWAAVLVIALAVALAVRAFVVQTFYIPSPSMEPTLMVGDRILVDKLSYHLHAVHRGDIVVFDRPPGERAAENVQDLVKRVVGLPGETIWSANGTVYVQGADTGNKATAVPEPVAGTPLGPPIPRQTLAPNHFYVMGDNRSNSDDSRFFGPIPGKLIVGRVVMRIWPISHLGFF